ncbi:MAG: hypothetical protein ACRDFT_07755 [bacterium]
MRARRSAAAGIAALVGIVVLAAHSGVSAQAGPVELILRLAKGEVLYYSDTSSGSTYISIGSAVTLRSAREAREAVRVVDVAEDGTMLLETVDEDERVTFEGTTTRPQPEPTMARVRPDGRVTETLWGDEGQFYPMMLPGRPVAVGATWSRETQYKEGTFTARGTDTYTLAAVDQTAEGRVARIRLQGQGSLTDSPLPIRLPQAWRSSSRGTVRASGEILWSVDRGRLISSTDDLFFDIEILITTPDGNARGSVTVRSTSKSAPLAPSTVPARTLDAAKMIVSGKSIGPYTMDMTIAQLTSQLGAGAATLADAGLRVLAVRWPPGLVGFFERENQDRLVGLHIADTTYRTEKGTGFGSTQGEVILAYGKPVELLLAIPKAGVWMLIYDELGIAFAVVSDKEHTGVGHAPLGAVDWTDIFPPGTAAKIYPLP